MIRYDEENNLFHLCTKNSLYQMKVDEYGTLIHTYYGKRTKISDYSYLIVSDDHGFSGNPYRVASHRSYSLDTLPLEYSCYGNGDYRPSALKVQEASGCYGMDLRYKKHRISSGKYKIPGLPAVYAEDDSEADTLVITLMDENETLQVDLHYGVFKEEDIITRMTRITNLGENQIFLDRAMSASVDFLYGEWDLITFYGKHNMERQVSRVPIHHGIQSVGSTRGASSHHYNPFFILADKNAGEDIGECYGFSFVYSGDFISEVEYDQLNQTRLVMGIHPGNFKYQLTKDESFYTPEVVMTYSTKGLEKLSRNYHEIYRNHLCRGKYRKSRRPVLINNWEGTYFDFTGEKLVQMAEEAAKLGIELFVMDDGWFGKRDNDISGLGDWFVNEEKLGCSLKELSDKIHNLGMQFGIWFEPECISEDSNLYRKHPEWTLKIPNRSPVRSRYQLVLDYSREDVREHIYTQICQVLDSAKIEYVKWDFNRSISDIYSALLPAKQQGEVAHRYVLGLYDMLEKLTSRYPDILFEGCSGGGGRFDAGMLYYTPQIWCSDNTDAIERLKIQYGTSFGYPISTVGSHVSACPNHQTKRVTPLHTRAAVAMAGTFGYELDINKLSELEKEEIRNQISLYKAYYNLIANGDYHRLSNPFQEEAYTAWQFVSETKEEALLTIVRTKLYPAESPRRIRLKGLKEDAIYCIDGKEYYSGDALMNGGWIIFRGACDYDSRIYHLKEVKGVESYTNIPHGDMPGDQIKIEQSHLDKARVIYPELLKLLNEQWKNKAEAKVVVAVCGGSGVGKSEIASLLAYFLEQDGIGSYVMSGDNYPHRIPCKNDAERLRVYETSGKEALASYLGSSEEIDFELVEKIITAFKAGASVIEMKRMGREESERWFDSVDISKVQVLLLEWTHSNSDNFSGVDIPILLNSTPQETLAHRKSRNRDGAVDSPFTTMVLELEQEMLKQQAHKAKIIITKSGEIISYQQYCKIMEME